MKNYNPQKLKNDVSNKLEMDFIFEEINEPSDFMLNTLSVYSSQHQSNH